jgi:tetratricopeptide (TPR) repeat protein
MGRRAEALQATQEAVDLYRRLAAQHPDAFLPDLANSLTNLSNVLFALDRWEEALQAAQEAVEIRRRLARQYPEAFLPDLAESLGAYGKALLGLGRAPEAREAFAEGLRILLPFVQEIPAAFGLAERAADYLRLRGGGGGARSLVARRAGRGFFPFGVGRAGDERRVGEAR